MIIDMHAHIWAGNYQRDTREIRRACQLYGIEQVYVSCLGDYHPSREEIEQDNGDTYRFMREEPGLVQGYCYVNPHHADAVDVLNQGITEYGMIGMKLWVASLCDDPRVFPLVERSIDYGIPILVHAFWKAVGQLQNESVGIHVANLASRYPEAKVIMAHLGGNCYNGIKAIKHCENVWVDISGSLFRRDDIDYTVAQIGAERVLFGTDMPICDFLLSYGQIEEANITECQRQRIYYANAKSLFAPNLKYPESRGVMEEK